MSMNTAVHIRKEGGGSPLLGGVSSLSVVIVFCAQGKKNVDV